MSSVMEAESSPKTPRQEEEVAPRSPATRGTRMGRRAYMVVALLVAFAAAGYAVFHSMTQGQESTDNAQIDADVTPVSARVSGTVSAVHVESNSFVHAGDLLIEIDPAELAAALRQAEAQVRIARAQAQAAHAQVSVIEASTRGGHAAAEAQLTGTSSSVRTAQASVAQARAALARAEANQAQVRRDADRSRALTERGVLAPAEDERARARLTEADAAVEQARAALSAAEAGSSQARAQVAVARGHVEQTEPIDAQLEVARSNAELADARIAAAEAAVERAQLSLSYTRIFAPEDGHITSVSVNPGQVVQPGSLLTYMVESDPYVVANFKETQVGDFEPGQRAEIDVDAYPDHPLHGHVESLSPGTGARFSLLPSDNATGNFVKVVQRVPVRILLDDLPEDLRLSAGLSVEVTVFTQ